MSRPNLFKGVDQTAKAFFEPQQKTQATPRPATMTLIPKAQKVRRSEKDLALKKQMVLDEARELGYTEGYERGLSEGKEAGSRVAYQLASTEASAKRKAELEVFTETLQGVLASANEAMARWYKLAEDEMGPIILEIAHKVLLAELKISRDSVLAIVKDAMTEVTHASQARLRINPFDSATMKEFKEEILACAPSVRGLEIVEDPSIEGGCVIETEGGHVDARIENKLQVIARSMKEAA